MKKNEKILTLAVFIAIFACFLLGDSVTAATLDALPTWMEPHAILHLEDVGAAVSKLVKNLPLDFIPASHERDIALKWLSELPLESISLVFGLMEDDEDRVQGALRFAPEVNIFLERLAAGKKEGENLDEKILESLLRFPDDEALRDQLEFSIKPSDEGNALYEVEIETYGMLYDILGDWEFFAAAEKDGDEFVLLVGSSPGDVEKARSALKGTKKRMKIERRAPHNNFLKLDDDKVASMTWGIFNKLDFKPKTPIFMELSFGSVDNGMGFSLRHNMFDVVFGDMEKLKSALSFEDPGLKFGGGASWLTGLGSVLLTGENVADLSMILFGREREEAIKFLNEYGINPADIVEEFQSFGIVLGGDSPVSGDDSIGGYAFISGSPEKMKAMIPFLKSVFETYPGWKETPREGWDMYYAPFEEGEPDCVFIGIKNGVLLAGSLSKESLDEAPRIEWLGTEAGQLLIVHLNMKELDSSLLKFISSPFAPLLSTVVSPTVLVTTPYVVIALRELGGVTLAVNDLGAIDLTFTAREENEQNTEQWKEQIYRLRENLW